MLCKVNFILFRAEEEIIVLIEINRMPLYPVILQ